MVPVGFFVGFVGVVVGVVGVVGCRGCRVVGLLSGCRVVVGITSGFYVGLSGRGSDGPMRADTLIGSALL